MLAGSRGSDLPCIGAQVSLKNAPGRSSGTASCSTAQPRSISSPAIFAPQRAAPSIVTRHRTVSIRSAYRIASVMEAAAGAIPEQGPRELLAILSRRYALDTFPERPVLA